MIVMVMLAETPPSYSITNLMAWVGTSISPSNVSNLPQRVSTNPGATVLGYIRSLISNDCFDNFYHMSPAKRLRLAGTTNINNLPLQYIESYTNHPPDSSVRILSLSNVCTNGNVFSFNMTLEEIHVNEVFASTGQIELVYTNASWKIDSDRSIYE